jgi:hypothetical protein
MPEIWCPAPTASVAGYQLLVQDEGPELVFRTMDYGFQRKVKWVTVMRRYRDQSFEVMPNSVTAMYEFTIKMERWTPDEIDTLEAFVDARKGSAYPFQFRAPDDNVMYNVRFKDDEQGYSVPIATLRTGTLELITIGDIDNSIDNDATYPPFVESVTFTTRTTTSTA